MTTTKGRKAAFREGSLLANLYSVLKDSKAHPSEEIVKALKAEKRLGDRTAANYVGGFRAGLKKAGFTLTSTEAGFVLAKK